jgi:hypothetical protein
MHLKTGARCVSEKIPVQLAAPVAALSNPPNNSVDPLQPIMVSSDYQEFANRNDATKA